MFPFTKVSFWVPILDLQPGTAISWNLGRGWTGVGDLVLGREGGGNPIALDVPGVMILTVARGNQSQKMGLVPFNPPLR